jgi:hypothetical protein
VQNHLSHSSLNALIEHISSKRANRQVLITTHSSFVLNKLGIDNVLLFSRKASSTLKALDSETLDYFRKFPGHDTLRLILAHRSILVEGPSDELIVQAAFKKKHGKMPIEAGVDVISVRALAFKRFLAIAKLLKLLVDVVTDNDGSVDAVNIQFRDCSGYMARPYFMARMRHRSIARERGISKALSVPPLGHGICRRRPRKLMCSGRAVFNTVGLEPLSRLNRWNSRRMGFCRAISSLNQPFKSFRPIAVFRRRIGFQSTARVGLAGGRSRSDLAA